MENNRFLGKFALESVLRESFSSDLFELGRKRIEVTHNILEIQGSV